MEMGDPLVTSGSQVIHSDSGRVRSTRPLSGSAKMAEDMLLDAGPDSECSTMMSLTGTTMYDDKATVQRIENVVQQHIAEIGLESLIERRVAEEIAATQVATEAAEGVVITARVSSIEKQLCGLEARIAQQNTQTANAAQMHQHSACSQSGLDTQSKSEWKATDCETLAMIPLSDPADGQKRTKLEHSLVTKIMGRMPQHGEKTDLEVVVREVTTSTVQEIVAIVDYLLDRLLVEKKRDTLRQIMGEIVTEDVSSIIAAGHKHLMDQQIGHLGKELERLEVQLQEGEKRWEERFSVTRELSDSQQDLWSTVCDRCAFLESRVATVEVQFVPRAEQTAELKKIQAELSNLQSKAQDLSTDGAKTRTQLEQFTSFCEEQYAANSKLQEVENGLVENQNNMQQRWTKELEELRSSVVSDTRFQSAHGALDKKLNKCATDVSEARASLDALETQLSTMKRFSEYTYASKLELQDHNNHLAEQLTKLDNDLKTNLADIDDRHATKAAVAEGHEAMLKAHRESRERQANTAALLREAAASLDTLKNKCEEQLATKEYVCTVAKQQALQVALNLDEKEIIAQLRREFEEERQRLRQTMKQQQHAREDLNEVLEDAHVLKQKTKDISKQCSQFSEHLGSLDNRVSENFHRGQSIAASHQKSISDLEVLFKSFRDEFSSHAEYQRQEGEKTRNYSTQRYLEQMDKALGLQRGLVEAESNHKHLSDTVRNLKLPNI